MVVLRVVFEDLGLLFVVEVPHKVIYLEVFPPFLTLNEPGSISVHLRTAKEKNDPTSALPARH